MTLNQIVRRIRKIAKSHKQIKHFYYGKVVEFLHNGDVVYPALFCDLNQSGGFIDANNFKTTYSFDFWFCELCNVSSKSRANYLDAQSDLVQIAEDIKCLFEDPNFSNNINYEDWIIDSVSSMEFYEEKFEDLVLAVKLNVKISTNYDKNRCNLPLYLEGDFNDDFSNDFDI